MCSGVRCYGMIGTRLVANCRVGMVRWWTGMGMVRYLPPFSCRTLKGDLWPMHLVRRRFGEILWPADGASPTGKV